MPYVLPRYVVPSFSCIVVPSRVLGMPLNQLYCFAYLSVGMIRPAFTRSALHVSAAAQMTMSGAPAPCSASFAVGTQRSHDLATPLALMFGFFFSKAAIISMLAFFEASSV